MYDQGSTVAITGCAGADEQNPSDLAIARARSSAVYLIQKGVAPQRVRVGSGCSEEGRTFEILLVAQGAVYLDRILEGLSPSTDAAGPVRSAAAARPSHPREPDRGAHFGDGSDFGAAPQRPSENHLVAPTRDSLGGSEQPIAAPASDVFPGNVAYKPESPMTVGTMYPVIVKISTTLTPDALAGQVRQAMSEANSGSARETTTTATIVTKPIEMTSKMRAHLSGIADEFSILPVTPEDQDTKVQNVTSWEWKVKPLKSRTHQEL